MKKIGDGMKNIALIGFGTVGKGVYEIIKNIGSSVSINVSKILSRDIDKNYDKNLFVKDYRKILEDDDIKIVVEMTGDEQASYEYIKRALENKKSVVTSNKAVVSTYLEEFLQIANNNNVCFLFEAAVGGTIPIIRELISLSKINKISKIYGILNGTGNYILYNMFKEDKAYLDVLKEAQELGYAERDPQDDVLGYDMQRKLRILSTIAFGGKVPEGDIKCFGIDKIKKEDVSYLKARGKIIKQVALSTLSDGEFSAIVEPCLMDENSDIGSVSDAYNIVEIYGNYFEKIIFKGPGAGRYPTASAVVQDVLDIVNNRASKISMGSKLNNKNDKLKGEFYLRISKDLDISSKFISSIEIFNDYKFIKTKKIYRNDLFKEIEKLNIEDYFYAKII